MRKPGFKLDGQPGCKLRSQQPDGKPYFRTGRRYVVWYSWLESVLAGTAENKAEMQILGSDTWHRVEATPAEACEALLTRKLGGQTAVKRALYIRERRMAKGLPICGTLK